MKLGKSKHDMFSIRVMSFLNQSATANGRLVTTKRFNNY